MSFKYTYKGVVHEVEDDIRRLTTSGKYLEDDITVEATGGGGTSLKLAPIKKNGTYSSLHFVQVATVKADSADNFWDSGISLYGKIPFVERVDLLQDYNGTNLQWFGYQTDDTSSGFGFWSNTIVRYLCTPNTTIEKSVGSTFNGLLRYYHTANGHTLTLTAVNEDGEEKEIGTATYEPVDSEITVAFGYRKSAASGIPQAFGIVKIKDLLTDEYIFNYTPMKDDSGHCWFYDDETEELISLPDGWIPGAVVSGGIELTGDGYAPFAVDVNDKFLGIPIDEIFKSTVDMTNFDMSWLTTIHERMLNYKFYGRGINLPAEIIFNGKTINGYGMQYMLANCKSSQQHIDVKFPNLRTVATYGLNYFMYDSSSTYQKHIRDVEIGKTGTNMSIGSYGFAYMLYGYSNLRNVIVRGITDLTASYGFAYAFRGITTSAACTIDGNFSFPDLKNVNANYALSYTFADRQFDVDNAKVINPFPKLENVKSTQAMSYMFRYSKVNKNSVFNFPKLKTLGDSNSSYVCQYMFQYTSGLWKYCWFPALETIGFNGATAYGIFSNAFVAGSEGTNPNTYQLCMPSLKHMTCSSTSTTATYGQFNACSLLRKVWMPQLQDVTGVPNQKNMFNSCGSIDEIHFGIAHEAYIKSLSGYATKFGASNATIYFDCVNTIAVNGLPYERDGDDYVIGVTNETNSATHEFTHPNDRYAWKNGGTVVYTLECWTPQVGDTVYDANDNAIGTIAAIEPQVNSITWPSPEWNNEFVVLTLNGTDYTAADKNKLPTMYAGTATISWRITTSTKYDSQSSLKVNGTSVPVNTTTTLSGNVTINIGFATCLAFGTKIKMYDGTERNVETLGTGDEVFGYNGVKQTIVEVSQSKCDEYDEWHFSNGTIIETAHRHRLYNVGRKAFVYLDEWIIGESTLDIDGNEVQLIKHVHFNEPIRHATLFCEPNNTYYANGLLAGNRYSNFEEVEYESI